MSGLALWLVDCARDQAALERCEAVGARLSDEELTRAARFKDEQERGRWRASHIALRLALEHEIGAEARRVPYRVAPGGRPYLSAPAPSFSLSHSAGAALVAVSLSGAVGVDLERIDARRIAVARRAALEAEAIRLASGAPLPEDDVARFIQAWCRIEAAAKCDGRGAGVIVGRALGRDEREDAGGRDSGPGARETNGESMRVWDLPLGESGGDLSSCFAAAVALSGGADAVPAPPSRAPGAGVGHRLRSISELTATALA